MANQLPASFEQRGVSDRFKGREGKSNLAAGVSMGFPVMSFRGKVWRVRWQGESTTLVREIDGEEVPRQYLDCVILKASPVLSRTFYAGGYQEGSHEAPDCFSDDGVRPDPSVDDPVHSNCASCPNAVWGSAISQSSGKKIMACSVNKRLAIGALGDLRNAKGGGPMLLRIPGTSLQALAQMGQSMQAQGYPDNSYAVRIGFTPDDAYPKLTFKATRPLSDNEADVVLELEESDEVSRILGSVGLADNEVEPEPEPAKPKKRSRKKAAAQPELEPEPEPDPEEEPEYEEEEEPVPDPEPEKPAPRSRRRKKAAAKTRAPDPEEEEEAVPEPEPAKRPRKKAAAKPAPAVEGEEEEGEESGEYLAEMDAALAEYGDE